MQCPLCKDSTLEARFSHGIEVDVCPNCSGVWLNHGELEKIAAQTVPQTESASPMKPFEPLDESTWDERRQSPDDADRSSWKSDRRQNDRDDDDHDDHDDDDVAEKKKSNKRSKKKDLSFGEMLEEVFDDLLDLDDLFDFD